MINPLKPDIEYAAEGVLLDLVESACVTNKKVKREDEFNQAGKILYLLDALTYYEYLEDEQVNNILECLKVSAELYDYPVAPGVNQLSPPVINIGPQGPQGEQGERGEDGGGTDFSAIGANSNTVVDSFAIGNANGARWDVLLSDGTNQEAGSIWATWLSDGSSIQDTGLISTQLGTISGIGLTITIFGTEVRLNAIITSGTWNIVGSRYFIPNNGAGITPPTGLSNGKIWIGNASNQAAEQTVSGDISISNTGVVSYTPLSIVNADINATASIAVNKLAAMTASRATVTDSSGFLTTSAATATEVGYLSGVTSSIQTQLDSKLSAATGAISTVVSSNLTVNRAVVSDPSGKIAVSGTTSTELGYLSGATSNIQAQINALGTNSQVTMNIGDWNMDTTLSVTLALPSGVTRTNFRNALVTIRGDSGDTSYPLCISSGLLGGYYVVSDLFSPTNTITLHRTVSGFFDNVNFSTTSFNRGWITIFYDA